jgi:hypothetical protein
MADNWDNQQTGEHFGRRSADMVTMELKQMLGGLNQSLVDIKEDIKRVEKHDREIIDLQYAQRTQQASIEGLTASIKELTAMVNNAVKSISDLSLKFFTGLAWIGGGAAVVGIVWMLLSAGLMHFGGVK